MPACPSHRPRLSRRILTPSDALPGLHAATRCGTVQCVVVACISADRQPLLMPIIDDCPSDRAGEVLRFILGVLGPTGEVGSLVLATSRPGTDVRPTAAEIVEFPALVSEARAAGWDLEEWYILADAEVAAVSGAT